MTAQRLIGALVLVLLFVCAGMTSWRPAHAVLEPGADILEITRGELDAMVYIIHQAGQPCASVSNARVQGETFRVACDRNDHIYNLSMVNGVAFVFVGE